MSFFLGLSCIPFFLCPFALGILCASDKTKSLFCYTGVCLSCIFSSTSAPIQFITYTFLYLLYKNFNDHKLCDKISTRLIASVFSSAFIGGVRLFTKAVSFDECFTFLTYISLTVTATYLFYPLFFKNNKDITPSQITLSLYSVLICLIPAANSIKISSVDTCLIFSGIITLIFAYTKGGIYGCVAGFISGFLCNNPLSSAPLGIAGLIAGYLFSKGYIICLCSFCLANFFTGIYIQGTASLTAFFPFSICSSLIFLIIRPYIPKIFYANSTKTDSKCTPCLTNDSTFDSVSDSLSGVSSILFKLAEHLKAPATNDTLDIIDNAFCEVCSNCSLNSLCFAKKECNFPALKQNLSTTLRSRQITNEEVSHKLLDKCIKSDELTNYINSHYSELCFLTMKANRTGTVAGLYSSMSRLIKAASINTKDNALHDSKLEKALSDALKKIGVEYSYMTVLGKRTKEIDIHGIHADKIPCSSSDLCHFLSKSCKTNFTPPSFDISDPCDMIMKFERAQAISVEYAQCASSAKEDEVNGDTVSFFDTDKGYFYSIIADGMGSGKEAAITSRLSCIFLQKLLCAGTAKNVSLEMLNNLLLSKNDETFSSIDLLEIDKIESTAYFIKAGAAPSFIFRNSRLYKISSKTPPVGIIQSFSAESTRFFLQKGDIIIMVSDGIIQSDLDTIWLGELIHEASEKEPCVIAKMLIEKAKLQKRTPDDASGCVIKII